MPPNINIYIKNQKNQNYPLTFQKLQLAELLEKAPVLPSEIKWHFIGALQTNKCKQLAEDIPNLWVVESVDAAKKADALEKGRASLISKKPEAQKLRVFVQVNTSGKHPCRGEGGRGGGGGGLSHL